MSNNPMRSSINEASATHPPHHHSSKNMSQRGAIFLTTAFALSGAAEGRRESWLIPGSGGCGTVNAIKRIEGSPTLEEEATGCVYVTRGSHSRLRGNLTK